MRSSDFSIYTVAKGKPPFSQDAPLTAALPARAISVSSDEPPNALALSSVNGTRNTDAAT